MPVPKSSFVDHVTSARPSLRAAQYVRMSTEQQKYSIESQQLFIAAYAQAYGIEIVRTYNDEGHSGVTFRRRESLRRLIADVQRGQKDFGHILVFDVSRWGRFQDIDESAHYEYICRKAGIAVHYCAEEFKNDGSLVAALLKGMKRAMAGEFSREQSAKVARAKRRQTALGYHVSGPAPLGFTRVLIDRNGMRKARLGPGDRKYLQDDRVILQPGSRRHIQTVRDIFRLFVTEHMAMTEIAGVLNAGKRFNVRGNPWTCGGIRRILRNEKYIGTITFNRTMTRLGNKRLALPKAKWTIVRRAIRPIIDSGTFAAAKKLLNEIGTFSDTDLLNYLTATWCAAGCLSSKIMQGSEGPAPLTYAERFGGLNAAYDLIGYRPTHGYRFAGGKIINSLSRALIDRLISGVQHHGGNIALNPKKHILMIAETSVTLVVLPYTARMKKFGWWLYSRHVEQSEHLLLARMTRDNAQLLDLYLLPFPKIFGAMYWIGDEYLSRLSGFRLHSPADLLPALRRPQPAASPSPPC
jgi:DNA invertase Pin-like site-specific DNA recombinase